ncbi:MAG: hypothetical protein HG439_000045 [candidate division SR1 bacterium]|nr:hypothetical protein [candidate division SR1 bacterium]MBB1579024.1 hypothetical protein [candidate division SR1 bacterium]MBF0932078.1 hypothetical protein [candidate division SR1 bacterium]RKW24633.1 MAG: hypothetical protein D8B45_01965 [Candidatus Gracilibacteria bacterium]
MRIPKLGSVNMYALASGIKIIFGGVILAITLTQLNIKEDPEISLALLLIGIFVCAWGISYFLFYGGEVLFGLNIPEEKMQKDAYKSSFLFGLYALINVLLIIGELWNKAIGILFLGLFVLMQRFIFTGQKKPEHD